jgi:hypothetical protein
MAALSQCCKAVADIQLHCLAGTGSSSMYYATQMRYVVNHCCSNLFSSSVHVHWRVTAAEIRHCGVLLHAL